MTFHLIQVRQKQILGCNDLVCIKVIMKFKNCTFFHNNDSFLCITIHFLSILPQNPTIAKCIFIRIMHSMRNIIKKPGLHFMFYRESQTF